MTEQSQMRHFLTIWEDQHPLARNSFILASITILVTIVLWLMTLILPALVSLTTYFKIAIVERVWFLAIALLLVIFGYSIIRIVWLTAKKRVSWLSFGVTLLAPITLLLPLFITPTFFQGAVRYQAGTSYGTVYDEFKTLCETWHQEHGEQGNVFFNIDETELGLFENSAKDVWREQSTVFFSFGEAGEEFGLACVVNDNEPADTGLRSRNFTYRRISGRYYEFYREQPSP